MAVLPQENIHVLSAVVTDAINKLSEIGFKLKASLSGFKPALNIYKQHLAAINQQLDMAEYPVLVDLMVVLNGGIDELLALERDLQPTEGEFLSALPGLLLDYLNLPNNKIPATILVKHFKNSLWVRPLTTQEYQNLIACIANRPKAQIQNAFRESVAEDSSLNVLQIDDPVDDDSALAEGEISMASTTAIDDAAQKTDVQFNKLMVDKDSIAEMGDVLDIELTGGVNEAAQEINIDDLDEALALDASVELPQQEGDVEDDALQLDDNVLAELEHIGSQAIEAGEEVVDESAQNITPEGIFESATEQLPAQTSEEGKVSDESYQYKAQPEHETLLEPLRQADGEDDLTVDDLEQKLESDNAGESDGDLQPSIEYEQQVDLEEFVDTQPADAVDDGAPQALDLDAFISQNMDLQPESQIANESLPGHEADRSGEDVEVSAISLDAFFDEDEQSVTAHSDADAVQGESVDLSQWIDDVAEMDEAAQLPAEQSVQQTCLSETESVAAQQTTENSHRVDVPTPGLDEQQQELVDLVRGELAAIIDDQVALQHLADAEVKQHIADMAEQAENISNAVTLIGLEGVANCSERISLNLAGITEIQQALDYALLAFINQWPGKLFACMQDIYDKKPAHELLDYLQDKIWPDPVDEVFAGQLKQQLENPVFSEDEVESRQKTATPADVSLEMPEDVNQELLEGLLQDLPTQTEEFSNAIQNLSEGGSLEDIEVAQRIAHTLKGAGNVVGVSGIANLTHHLEDILEAHGKAQRLPGKAMRDVLLSASDCLEGMAEALLGIDEAPDDALSILQSVLDWANILDTRGVPESDQAELSVSTSEAGSSIEEADTQQAKAANKENQPLENMLRIPTTLADDMLRLAGENLISTGQVQENIKKLLQRQESIRLHNQSLQQLSYDMEHLIDIQGVASQFNKTLEDDADFDPLEMDQFNELHSVSRRLVEIAADSVELTNTLNQELTSLHNLVIDQNLLQRESQELVLRTRMVSIKNMIPRIKRGVRQASRVTGKQIELEVTDNNTYMDSEVLNELMEPLMHILRNAVDHGIESADQRKAKGKSEAGHISVNFTRMGDQVAINIEDDGKGLNNDEILAKAIESGLVEKNEELTEEAVTRLILEPGFSTKEVVTQVSGRGIGLDVVSVKMRELKGSIAISSVYGMGSRFELLLPVSSFSTHSLLVRVRENIYAMSNRGVEEILYAGIGELCDIGEDMVLELEDEAYPAILLDELLNLPEDRRNILRTERPILLIRDDTGSKTAILVQEVLDSRDVVVKPLGQYLPKLPGIAGATVLGDGSVAPVVDLPELLQDSSMRQKGETGEAENPAQSVVRLPYVLVVDDSLSARRSLAQFVQDLGLEVRTARDGMEAVSLIEARQPDLILVDMEMPRMNGLELTSHVRASANTEELPVIMITSRSTDKHREAALEKGVNHFMVKPFAEDELALHINNALVVAS